jgi:hypothetical protein
MAPQRVNTGWRRGRIVNETSRRGALQDQETAASEKSISRNPGNLFIAAGKHAPEHPSFHAKPEQ